jgi:hypothetical protein
MVLFQNCVRQSRSPTKMAATVQLRCYWKQLWSRWAITGSWEPLVLFIDDFFGFASLLLCLVSFRFVSFLLYLVSFLLCLVSFRFVSVSFLVLQSPILAMLIAAKFITCKTKFFWFFFNELIYQSKSRNHRIITQNIHICIRIFLFVSKISICKTGIRCSKQDQINVSNYSILRVFVHLSFSTTPILTARESANP